jgi:tetratricopeptide (TPR) repeat protein
MSPDGALGEITLPFADPAGQAASLLEAALASSTHPTEVEKLLRHHLLNEPDYLPAYFALYKLLFRQSRLAEAEEIARNAMDRGARLGGFPPNWQHLAPNTADWSMIHSPAHFYLFTLKALSFILLRRKRLDECREVLEKIGELDPHDLIGASVIRAYADGLTAH